MDSYDGALAADSIADVSFADPVFLADPWPTLERLRREAPVFYSQNQGGWVISRHADVRAAYADRRLSAARINQLFRNIPQDVADRLTSVRLYTGINVNRLDGSDHIRVRSLMLKAFDAGVVRNLQSFIGEVVEDLLDECERAGEFDFGEMIGARLPTTVMCRLFDLPLEYRPVLFNYATISTSTTAAATVTPELLLRLEDAINDMNRVLNEKIREREQKPGSDLISTMVHARDGLNKLTHDELLAQLLALVVAGAETTAHTLATQLVMFDRHPALVERIRAEPESAFAIVTELLRYPGTVKCMTRYAAETIEIGGQTIGKGDLLWIMNASANVDPDVFADPYTIDPDRKNMRDAMSFGPGLHFCVGHMLARTELSEFFRRAYLRFNVEILQDRFEMVPSYIFYGYRSLRVRFTSRSATS
jgi:cytochrome P450 PksS